MNKKSGFSLLEMIMVIMIAGIIYSTVVDNVAETLDSARKSAFLEKVVNTSKLVCETYKSDNRLSQGDSEFFNHYDPIDTTLHSGQFDTININDYVENLGNSVIINTISGWTDASRPNTIEYFYRNGECLTVFHLSKQLFNNKDFLSNSFKREVEEIGSNWKITLTTFKDFENNLRDKHLLNVRNNIYRDRKEQGTFNNTDLDGNNIQTAAGFTRVNVGGNSVFLTLEDFNEVNDDDIVLNSYLYQEDNDGIPATPNTLGSNRTNDDPYDSNLIKPVRFNNNSYSITKDYTSPLRKREENLKVNTMKAEGNYNGYLSNTNEQSGYIPGGRGFITCKKDETNCYDTNISPNVDKIGIKVTQP